MNAYISKHILYRAMGEWDIEGERYDVSEATVI